MSAVLTQSCHPCCKENRSKLQEHCTLKTARLCYVKHPEDVWSLQLSLCCLGKDLTPHAPVESTHGHPAWEVSPQAYNEIIQEEYEFRRFWIRACESFLALLIQHILYI